MGKRTFILIVLFLFIYPLQTSSMAINEEEKQSPKFISSMEADITGDGIKEYIKIQGYLLSKQSNFFTDVWININSLFNQQWKISVHGGYSPKLELFDLTHNNTADLFYESKVDENKERYQYQLYSLLNGEVKQIELPSNIYFVGEFQEDFSIKFQLNPNDKILTEDLSSKRSFYIKNQLYDENGKLLKEQPIKLLKPIKMKPLLISRSKGYGLITTQQVKGINENDIIGHLETLWYYDQKKWIKFNSNWNVIKE